MSARRDKWHAGRGQVYVGNALVEHSVAVALSWCNAQVTNDVRAISLRRSKAADGLRLAASRRQAGVWHQLLATCKPRGRWPCVPCCMRVERPWRSSEQTCMPIVLIAACGPQNICGEPDRFQGW
jgi:hypothetical protein